MNTLSSVSAVESEELYDNIVHALESRGYIVLLAPLPVELVDALFVHFESLDKSRFRDAGIGRQTDHQINPFVRTDRICWLEDSHPAVKAYLDWMEELRLALNRKLFLGLFDYECHYAYYPQGAFYKRHLDAFKGETSRLVSTVLYLNPDWAPADGGELVLYASETAKSIEQIAPQYGRMVLFLSEDIPHEVLKTYKPRRSVTGWFRAGERDLPL